MKKTKKEIKKLEKKVTGLQLRLESLEMFIDDLIFASENQEDQGETDSAEAEVTEQVEPADKEEVKENS